VSQADQSDSPPFEYNLSLYTPIKRGSSKGRAKGSTLRDDNRMEVDMQGEGEDEDDEIVSSRIPTGGGTFSLGE